MTETLKPVLGGRDGGRILDLGTGQGQFARVLMESFGRYTRITGADIVDPAATVAEDLRDRPDMEWVQVSGDGLPFADAAFDTVAISNTLHHLPRERIRPTLGEMRRVLRSGGQFIIADFVRDAPTPAQASHVRMHHWIAGIDRLCGVCHEPTMTRAEFMHLVCGLGLVGLRVLEHAEEEVVTERADLDALAGRMDRALSRLEGHPAHARLEVEGAAIKRHMAASGFALAPCLLALGRVIY